MIAEHRHAGAGHGADGGLVVLDLLVAAFEAHHRLVVEMGGDVLDRLELQAGGLDLLDQRADVLLLPARIAGQRRVVHLQAGGADLRGEAQPLLRQVVELAHCYPDLHFLAFPALLSSCITPGRPRESGNLCLDSLRDF